MVPWDFFFLFHFYISLYFRRRDCVFIISMYLLLKVQGVGQIVLDRRSLLSQVLGTYRRLSSKPPKGVNYMNYKMTLSSQSWTVLLIAFYLLALKDLRNTSLIIKTVVQKMVSPSHPTERSKVIFLISL